MSQLLVVASTEEIPDGQSSAANGEIRKTCFIVSPIGEDGSEARKRSDQVKKYVIDPAVASVGYVTTRADLTNESGQITNQIVSQLLGADLVVADLTDHNPNVFYELAIRHAFGRPFIQVIDKKGRLPFDVAGQWTVFFDHRDLDSVDEAKKQIARAAKIIFDGGDDYKTESPVSQAIDLQQLRSSGNPEQIAMAEMSEMLTDIRTEMRRTRTFSQRPGYTSDQLAAIRQVLLGMAADGRFGMDELKILEAVPETKNFMSFVDALKDVIGKRDPWSRAPKDDPWGSAPASGSFSGSDDEPPF